MLGAACSLLPQERQPRAAEMEQAVLPMARAALESGQVETARRLYRRVLQVDASSIAARMGLGDAAVAGGSSAEAARWYLAALANAQRPEERHAALLAHGRAALSAGQLEGARKSFARLTDPGYGAPEPVVAWAYNGLGLTLLLAGDLRGGVAAMEQAVLRAPDEPRFQGNLTRGLAMLTELEGSGRHPGPESVVTRARDPAEVEGPAAPTTAAQRRPTGAGGAAGGLPQAATVAPLEADLPDAGAVDGTLAEPQVAAPAAAGEAGATDADERLDGSMPPASEAPAEDTAGGVEIAGPMSEPDPGPASGVETSEGAMPAASDTVVVGVSAPEPAVPGEVVAVGDGGATAAVEAPAVADAPSQPAVPDAAVVADPVLDWEVVGRLSASDGDSVDGVETPAGPVPLAPDASLEPTVRDPAVVGGGVTQPEAVGAVAAPDGDAADAAGVAAGATRTAPEGVPDAGLPDPAGIEGAAPAPAVVAGPAAAPGIYSVDVESHGGRDAAGSELGMVDVRDSAPIVVREGGGMEVQVGAFRHPWRAERLSVRLRELIEHPVWASEIVQRGEAPPFWRVRIGPVPSREALLQLTATLESVGFAPLRPRGAPATRPAAGGVASVVVPEDGERFVQAGAYVGRRTAEEVANRLGLVTEHPAGVSRVEVDGGRTVYRVRVGPLASHEELVEVAEALELAGFGAVVVAWSVDAPEARGGSASEREPSAPFVVRENGERYIQVGAYVLRCKADGLATRLRAVIESPTQVTAAVGVDGQALYRVRIGPVDPATGLGGLLEAAEAVRRQAD